ncbi:unnamed protein product [Ectocarpus sp. CCAP 1310/34]|nr:unnamed protein product [Ectocarpus sp. CCAP 1310/34]
MKALHEDSDIDINKRAVQNAAATVHGAEKPRDAADAYEEVMAATADGGLCEIKMDDSGRLTHIWWQTREQVVLWNRYGHVALYDDTAVKNRYRMPLGVLAVIDSEYRTRIVGQSITADTTTDTFLWMLKSALESRGGKQPDIFIQDADAAMTAAVREVFPDALARRCLWHLNQNIIKALAKVLGGEMKTAFHGRVQVCASAAVIGKERKFNALIEKHPKAEKYMRVVYDDRARWVEYVSPLVFSVGLWTTSSVEGQNALIKDKCNSRSSLLDVATYFSGIIRSQKDAPMLRDAIDHLPPNRMVAPPATAFKKSVLESCEFSIAGWPRRFMEQEMTAAIMFCQMGGGEADGPERAAALGRTFEYIEGKLCGVIYVFRIHEQRDGKAFDYLILLFSDGSNLCQCRTLQTLGLFCRHVWAAMMHSPRFRFHVGLLHEHWLTEKARGTPQQDWPDVARPRWVVSNRHAAREVDGAAGEGEGGGWGDAAGGGSLSLGAARRCRRSCWT